MNYFRQINLIFLVENKIIRFILNKLICQLVILVSLNIFPQSFQVVSTSPTFNEITSEVQPHISVEFNKAVDSVSIDNISFSVFGERSAYHAGSYHFTNGNYTVSFTSNANYNAGERVTVNLSRKILSENGDTLNGLSWTFRVPSQPKLLNFSDPSAYMGAGFYGGGGLGMQCIDMNNDGFPDILTSVGYIWLNDGNGGFPTYWYIDDTDEFSQNIIADDFNRDGFVDVFYYGVNGFLMLGLGNGMGSFIKSYYPIWFYDYTSADINSDGYPDIIGINRVFENPDYDTTSYFAIALNDGTGHLNDTTWGGHLSGSFQKIAHSDIDNDGDSDVLIISHLAVTPGPIITGFEGLVIFKNSGMGSFNNIQLIPPCDDFRIYFPNYLYSSDFNNDGFTDVAVLAGMGGGVTLNKGNGIFGECFDTLNTRHFWGPELPATMTGGDLNGDSWIDLAVSGFTMPFEPDLPRQYAVLNNCNSYLQIPCGNNIPYFDTLGTSDALIFANAAADLNNDGFLDLVHSGNGVYITIAQDITPSINDNSEAPKEFVLYNNYPNPFNPKTKIRYEVSVTTDVKLKVFNVIGEEIAILIDEIKYPGSYEVEFDASDLSSGVYFTLLQTPEALQSRSMLLIK